MRPGAAGLIVVVVGRAVATHESLQILLVNVAVGAAASPGDVARATISLPVVHRRLHHLLELGVLAAILHLLLLLLNLRYHTPQDLNLLIFLFNFLVELVVLGHVPEVSARGRLRGQGVLLDEDALVGAALVRGDGLRALEGLGMRPTPLLLLVLTWARVEYLSTLRPAESGIASSSHFEGRLAHFNTSHLQIVVLYHRLIAPPYGLRSLLRVPRL